MLYSKIQVLCSCILLSLFSLLSYISHLFRTYGIFSGQDLCLKHAKYADWIQCTKCNKHTLYLHEICICNNIWNICRKIIIIIYYFIYIYIFIIFFYSLIKLYKFYKLLHHFTLVICIYKFFMSLYIPPTLMGYTATLRKFIF